MKAIELVMRMGIRVWCLVAAAALLAGAAGCAKPLPRPSAAKPRIASFSPAITDMLFDLGLGDHVVGVTTQCDVPGNLPGGQPTVLGDVLSGVNAERIVAAKPDVLLIQMNAELFEPVRKLDGKLRVEHFTIESLADIAGAIERIADIAGAPAVGKAKKQEFLDQLAALRRRVDQAFGPGATQPAPARPKVLMVWGTDRPSTGGRNTFISEMIEAAGGVNAAEKYEGWKSINVEMAVNAAPDILVCLDESGRPDDAKAYWLRVQELPAARAGRVFVVSDRRWTIPSARSPKYVAELADMICPPAKASQP
jgi:iron complex transport system substrate-binding protein